MKDLKKVKPSRKPGPADLRRSHILQKCGSIFSMPRHGGFRGLIRIDWKKHAGDSKKGRKKFGYIMCFNIIWSMIIDMLSLWYWQGLVNVRFEHYPTLRDKISNRYLKVMLKISETEHLPTLNLTIIRDILPDCRGKIKSFILALRRSRPCIKLRRDALVFWA